MLVHHADAGGHGVAGPGEVLDVVVEQDLALVGLVQAVQHVHEGRLARAVLTEQAVDLAGFDREVDVVVGDQGAEPLGDAAKFELHVPILCVGIRVRRRHGLSVSRIARPGTPLRHADASWRPASALTGSAAYFGDDGDSTLIVPPMMSALMVVQLTLQVGVDLVLEVVERREADSAVLQGADVRRVVELAWRPRP